MLLLEQGQLKQGDPQIETINKQYSKVVHLFFKVTSKINNTQVDNAKDVDVKMTMYNLM